VREIISFRLVCAGAQDEKAGRKARGQEGGKRSHKTCIFHVCVEQSLEGGIQPNLAECVRLTDVIKFIVGT